MKLLSFLFIFFLSNFSYADVNKCIDSKGKITFTDKVCSSGHIATTVKIKPTNIIDSSSDKRAIQQLKDYEYEQSQAKYYNKLRNARIQANAREYEHNLNINNESRIARSKSPLPNGLGTGKGCYKESKQYYCY